LIAVRVRYAGYRGPRIKDGIDVVPGEITDPG